MDAALFAISDPGGSFPSRCRFHILCLEASSMLVSRACAGRLCSFVIKTSMSRSKAPKYSRVKLRTPTPPFFSEIKILCLASVDMYFMR